jgi:hypothetical protein
VGSAYRIETKDRVYEFEGELLGESSSEGPSKPRWYEVHLYLTPGGKYVVDLVAASGMPGEVDLHTVHVTDDPEKVLANLEIVEEGSEPHITFVGIRALDEAAASDRGIASVWDEATRRDYLQRRQGRPAKRVRVD